MLPWIRGVAVRLHTRRPDCQYLPSDSLAAQLRRRRRELRQTRDQAAASIGVCPKTLRWWEENAREPSVGMYPALINYLGAEPWRPPTSPGERLLAARRRRGLSLRAAAFIIGVDEGTLLRCERLNDWPRYSEPRRKLAQFLHG